MEQELLYSSGTPEFTPGFQFGSCCSIFSVLWIFLWIIVCHCTHFPLAIVLYVRHRFTISDRPM